MDRTSELRSRPLLQIIGMLAAPVIATGYLAMTALLVLPLLAVRGLFPRRGERPLAISRPTWRHSPCRRSHW
jgi:hypothetical protein